MSGNRGHGHVNPRPDGVRARCGGPGFCAECSHEQAMAIKGDADIKALREENAKLQSEAGNLREAFDEIAHLRKEIERLKADIEDRKDAYSELDDANILLNERLAEAVKLLNGLPYLEIDPAYVKIREFLAKVKT